MALFRRTRFWFLLLRELGRTYKTALAAGLVVGLAASLVFWRVYPLLRATFSSSTERIGVVGEFSPSTLPAEIQESISLGLTRIATDGSAQSALATSWEATDSGKTYVFTLKEDMAWHGGRELLAQDVNYNIRSVTFTPQGDHQLVASLENAYSPFPTLVAKPIFLPGLRGVGSYRVGRIQLKGDRVVYLKLIPEEDQRLPAKEYRFYRTEAALIEGYKMGDVDILDDVSRTDQLASWGRVTVSEEVHDNRVVALFFNLSNQLLSEKNVRHGLAYAVPDFKEERAFSPISKTSWAYTDLVKKFGFDLDEAEDLLSAAGIATASAELTITTFAPYLERAQAIANSWTALGVTTTVKVENVVPQDYQVLLTAQELPPDPDQYPFWHSTQTQTNITGYVNVKIDKLLEDGRQIQDLEERKTIYGDFQRRLVEDAPAVFLYYPKTYTIKRGK
jgi:peptide/nickel transport system substrate-binding protein